MSPSDADHDKVVTDIAGLIRERGALPAELGSYVVAALGTWETGAPDEAILAEVKTALWAYLKGKHDGTSTAIDDIEDRTVRAALCLTETASADPADLLEWAMAMLPSTRD